MSHRSAGHPPAGSAPAAASIDACPACLRRTALVAALSGRIEHEWRLRTGRPRLLALSDADLLEWGADQRAAAGYAAFSAEVAVDGLLAAGVGAVCRCSARYPARVKQLPDPPAVLHVRGDPALLHGTTVALVGARRASAVGLEVAGALARGLAVAGVPVVSGMALGVDGAAHAGALDAGGGTVAVLATGADRPYPARHSGLHGRISAGGCVVSELPPGTEPRRWAFPARNRVIAALAAVTVVVEGGERSGSLITADFAADLGRAVGAVPGPVTSTLAAGPNALLKLGAEVIRGSEDVLDLLAQVPDDDDDRRRAAAAARARPGRRGPLLRASDPRHGPARGGGTGGHAGPGGSPSTHAGGARPDRGGGGLPGHAGHERRRRVRGLVRPR